MGLLLGGILILFSPNQATAPNTIQTERLLLVEENSVIATEIPSFPLRFSSLANLGDSSNAYTISVFVLERYPEMSELLLDLAKCEARWKHDGLWGDNYQSYGIFQMQKRTFYSYCEGDWQDMEDQLDCTAKMIRMDLGHTTTGWYNCWRIMNLWQYSF